MSNGPVSAADDAEQLLKAEEEELPLNNPFDGTIGSNSKLESRPRYSSEIPRKFLPWILRPSTRGSAQSVGQIRGFSTKFAGVRRL